MKKHTDGTYIGLWHATRIRNLWISIQLLHTLAQTENYSYGAQLGGILRIGDNDRGLHSRRYVLKQPCGEHVKVTDSLSASCQIRLLESE